MKKDNILLKLCLWVLILIPIVTIGDYYLFGGYTIFQYFFQNCIEFGCFMMGFIVCYLLVKKKEVQE